jgi:leucyl-tRNA synthetase
MVKAKERKINFAKIEQKWQKEWQEKKVFEAKESGGEKCYVLEMYPYPSANFLHMGHVRNYTIGDVYARFKRMNGFNVLYPMGYDSFGLPAETAAKKEGIHPKKYAETSIKKIMQYQKALGNSYDWSRLIKSHDPDYYKWNQYFFLKLYEKGLAYRKKASVNWCMKCESVLANEEAESGKCWRCGEEVMKKDLEQWFFKITEYADRLLKDLKKINWPEKIKIMQKNWIGKSYGTEINFKVDDEIWPVFTTRPDTIFGVTFMAISAQHPKLLEFVSKGKKEEARRFAEKCKKARTQKEIESLEKEGIFTGRYAVNPVNNEKVPVYAGNFVVADYGSGMVMAVPAHDQRDYEFAEKYNLPVKEVISGGDIKKRAYIDSGVLINSGKFNGINSEKAKQKITQYLEKKKLGRKKIEYRIRDWLISRQRYWGTPIPIIYCEKCGVVPVPEKDLPVLLPEKVNFKARINPLLSAKNFVNAKCPKCGMLGKRETDTMGGFVDSSWYFLRFCDPKNKKKYFDKKKVAYWMPVDQYIGGAEHAVMHLIYARFFTKALRDLGIVKFDEPFTKLFNQGIVYKDSKKMSKSYGNVVFQTDISEKYSIDTARLFLMFVSSPDKQMVWTDQGVEGAFRIINKLINLKEKIAKQDVGGKESENKVNITIKKVTENIENFQYPKSVIAIIEALDYFSQGISRKNYETLLKLLSPFCPHITEELWHKLGNKSFISLEKWPGAGKIDEKLLKEEEQIEKLIEDIRNILKILDARGKKGREVKVFAIPKELALYKKAKEKMEIKTGMKVEILSVKQIGAGEKKIKAKPGKPGILIE